MSAGQHVVMRTQMQCVPASAGLASIHKTPEAFGVNEFGVGLPYDGLPRY